MWPPDFWTRLGGDMRLVRMGAQDLQIWHVLGSGLELKHSCPVDACLGGGPDRLPKLKDALNELLSREEAKGRYDVVVDSRWMPLVLLDIGPIPLRSATVFELARHRFRSVHGEAVNHWKITCDYVPGEVRALAAALPIATNEAIQQAFADGPVGMRLVSIQSTFTWVMAREASKLVRRAANCFGLLEQDRMLLSYAHRGVIQAFNPCGELVDPKGSVQACIDRAALRCGWGLPKFESLLVSFDAGSVGPLADERVRWSLLSNPTVA